MLILMDMDMACHNCSNRFRMSKSFHYHLLVPIKIVCIIDLIQGNLSLICMNLSFLRNEPYLIRLNFYKLWLDFQLLLEQLGQLLFVHRHRRIVSIFHQTVTMQHYHCTQYSSSILYQTHTTHYKPTYA